MQRKKVLLFILAGAIIFVAIIVMINILIKGSEKEALEPSEVFLKEPNPQEESAIRKEEKDLSIPPEEKEPELESQSAVSEPLLN